MVNCVLTNPKKLSNVGGFKVVFNSVEKNACQIGSFFQVRLKMTSWPLVGNEGMNPQYTNVKVDSLIPY